MILQLLLAGALALAAPAASVSGAYDAHFTSERLRMDIVLAGDAHSQTAYLDDLHKESTWAGTRENLIDPYGFGQYRVEAFSGDTLIWRQGFNTLFEEWRDTEQAGTVSMAAGQSVWMPFPKRPIHVAISSRDRGVFSTMLEFDVDPADRHIVPTSSGYKTVPLMVNGPSSEKVDMVIAAEGYKSSQMRKFRKDAQRMLDYFFSMEPYRSRKSDFNVWLVESTSQDSGVSIPQEGKWRSTVIGSSFDTFYMDRYLAVMDHRRIADAMSDAPVDAAVVLANDSKYGGGGFYNSYAMMTSDNRWSPQVFIHEFGHSFAGLADEYYEPGASAFDTLYPADIEPWEPNVTTLVDFGAKWKDMMGLAGSGCGPVGLFEGGGYMPRGIWRPCVECRMKNNTSPEFCPVCQRAIMRMIDYYCGSVAVPSRVPQVSGHRGADDIAPENTMASADSCIRYNVDVMECDVTMSSDSVFYLLHDWTLDRTTDGTGHAWEHTSAYLDSLDAGSWYGLEWKGQHLLRFEDLLHRAYGAGLGITVDYRCGKFSDIVELVSRCGMLARTNFTFSRESDCVEFRREFPSIHTLQAYATSIAEVDRVSALYSPDIIVCWIDSMDQAFVDYCHSRGLKVLALVLGLDDKSAQFAKCLSLGVDVVATDHPTAFPKAR